MIIQDGKTEIEIQTEEIRKLTNSLKGSFVNTNIIGNQNIVASGNNISQNVDQKIIKTDIEGLLKYMKEIGVSADDADHLKIAIEEDGLITEQKKFGSKVIDWIGNITKKIVEGTCNDALSNTPTLIIKALFRYYGWE